jgi:uncharacterized protein YcbX
MRVMELWRYPVKSLQGEQVDAATLTAEGIEGDRRFAIFDLATGLGLTGRRAPELLFATARLRDDGSVHIALPDGSSATDDDALSAWLGRPVALRSTEGAISRSYENPLDFEHEPVSAWEEYEGAPGAFHDEPGANVSLVSTGTLRDWDRRRFRANVVLDGEGEDDLLGCRVTLGEAVLDVGMRIPRCVMTTRAQPDLERDLDVLRTIARERDAYLAVGATISTGGVVRVGDELAGTGAARSQPGAP